MKAVTDSRRTGQITIEQLCNSVHLKRDAYYKHRRRYSLREAVESQVIGLVKKERDIQSRVGTRRHSIQRTTAEIKRTPARAYLAIAIS